MIDQPLVSIGVPTYNAKAYLEETIQSILNQDYPHLELLIQDNCSTDGTWELLQDLAAHHPQISVEQNERNLGMVGNFNRVMNRARGDYKMVMGSDDLLEPGFVRRCVEQFAQSPDVGVVTTNYHYFTGPKKWEKLIQLAPGIHRHFVAGVVIANNFSLNFTLFSRQAVDQLRENGNLFLTTFYTFDLEMWFRIALANIPVYYISDCLGNFRVHAASTSKRQNVRMFKQIFLVLMMHRRAIKQVAMVQYRVKLARFTMRQIGYLLSGQSKDMRLLRAIVGELLR